MTLAAPSDAPLCTQLLRQASALPWSRSPVNWQLRPFGGHQARAASGRTHDNATARQTQAVHMRIGIVHFEGATRERWRHGNGCGWRCGPWLFMLLFLGRVSVLVTATCRQTITLMPAFVWLQVVAPRQLDFGGATGMYTLSRWTQLCQAFMRAVCS